MKRKNPQAVQFGERSLEEREFKATRQEKRGGTVSGDTAMLGESNVKLKSCDNQIFEVEESVASESQVLKQMIEDMGSESVIDLPNVTGQMLDMVVEYCKYHVCVQKKSSDDKQTVPKEEMELWKTEFIKAHELTSYSNIRDIVVISDSLKIKSMLKFGARLFADQIMGKSVEEIRGYFRIVNDFTPEEEEEIKRQDLWIRN